MATNIPLVPKGADGILQVISVGRLSQPKETEEKTLESLEAIRKENERLLNHMYDGPKNILYLAEQTSGMLATRKTLSQLWSEVSTGKWDVIVAEDLSRIFRNPRFQMAFVQDAVDAQIRVICFADQLDTASEHWETSLACATVRHGLVIPDTRRRIRRKATEAFHRGGQVGKVRVAYLRVSKEDAQAGKYGPVGLRIRRNPDFTPILQEICTRLEQGHSPQSVVAWLNHSAISVGAYVKNGRWTLKLFRTLVEDPLLHGTRRFRVTKHRPIFRTGKYAKDANPDPETEYVAELAYMTREEQMAMLAHVGWRINWGAKSPPPTPHPQKGLSRYDTTWPGQAVTCTICSAKMFKYGEVLRCRNSYPRCNETCWNHVLVPIEPLRNHAVQWLIHQSAQCAHFRHVFFDAIRGAYRRNSENRSAQHRECHAEIASLEVKERNLRKSIGIAKELSSDALESLVRDLSDVASQLNRKRRLLEQLVDPPEIGELTDEVICSQLADLLSQLISTSFEMAEVLRQLIVCCEIVPVQALDSGLVRPRAKVAFRTFASGPDGSIVEDVEETIVDLFKPAAHIAIVREAVTLRRGTPRPTLKQIAKMLGTGYMTVKRALAYQELMDQEGVSDLYRELTSKPTSASRWRHAS